MKANCLNASSTAVMQHNNNSKTNKRKRNRMKTKTKSEKNTNIQMLTRKDYLEKYERKTKSGGERKKTKEEEEEEKVEEKEEFMFCYVWIITFMRAFHNMLLYISNYSSYFSSFVLNI